MKKGKTEKHDPEGMSLPAAVVFLLVGMVVVTSLATTSWGRKISLKQSDKVREINERKNGTLLSLVTAEPETLAEPVSSGNWDTQGLQSIGVSFANTEDGNGGVILEKLLRIRPQAALKEKRVMELTEQLAKKKDFSLYPEVAVYPKDFYTLWKQPYPFSAKEYESLGALLQGTVASIQERDDIPSEKALQSIMVTGVKLAAEQDYNTVSGFWTGIKIAQTACKALIEHHIDGGDQEKADRYLEYERILEQQDKNIREATIHWTPLMAALYDQESAYGKIKQAGEVQQPMIQIKNLTPLAYMYYELDDQRKESAKGVLEIYRDRSQSPFVREFSGKVLKGDFEWQIRGRGKQLEADWLANEKTQ